MQNNKKLLICSLGSIGKRHLRLLNANWPSIKISIFRSGANKKNNISKDTIENVENIFTDLKDTLDWKPDMAIISSPASMHLEQALSLSSKNIPLLIEKPLGTGYESSIEWKKLESFAKKTPILVGYVLRHDPTIIRFKEKLYSGKLGKIVDAEFYCGSWLPSWRQDVDYTKSVSSQKELGGGALLELSHELDLALNLFGKLSVISAYFSKSSDLITDVEDSVSLAAISNQGTPLSIRLNFCTKPAKRYILVRGTKSDLFCDLNTGYIKENFVFSSGYSLNDNLNQDTKYILQLDHFFQVALGCEPPLCSLSDGLDVLELINQARAIENSNNHLLND